MRPADRACDAELVRCLIVDDSLGFLAAARRLLERGGITVAGVAANGAEALLRAKELRPDAVLIDIDLGGESGLELAGRLRDLVEPTRIIMVSTHASMHLRDNRLRLTIRDDGDGGAVPASGSGLIGLTDRIETLGGTLTITSPPGQGTTLLADLPIEAGQGGKPASRRR
jgi:two-component system, NarL family, nitrate/nitrite response regulator NarL